MKVSKSWLNEWVKTDISTDALTKKLAMVGLEVDSVAPVAVEFTHIVVGHVLTVKLHPDADKLHLCEVDIGNEKLSIVCGAPNVRPGLKVPTAIVGAEIGDFKIKKAKLRGVESFGMLCSAKELGMAETSAGIMELPEGAPVGEDFRKYFNLDDEVIDIELTPNRGDCASILGVAREVSAITKCKYDSPEIKSVAAKNTLTFQVKLSSPKDCPHYVGRVINNINVKAQTPVWMQEKLRRCGIRSIAPVVDVTNYVLLELGQPMHAFDLGKLDKGIEVRLAKKDESLLLLNGEEVKLEPDVLVIADAKQPVALAGVMGGEATGVQDLTQNIFLESAFFNPITVSQQAAKYGLQSDSSYRFSRGVDPAIQVMAMERATQLLLDVVGGEPGPVIEAKENKYIPKVKTISLRFARTNKILGTDINNDEIVNILNRLGLIVNAKHKEATDVEVPTFRFDINLEIDLIEEIGRIYGYDNIPLTPYQSGIRIPDLDKKLSYINEMRFVLQNRDYHEVVTYSFISSDSQKQLDPKEETIKVVNPITSDMEVMRTNLWSGLLNTLVYNLNRQQNRVRLFETGLRFRKVKNQLEQTSVISGLIYGNINEEQWGEKPRTVDFFDLKSDVEPLFSLTGEVQSFEYRSAQYAALHPGQSAEVFKNGQSIGVFGALHPMITQQLALAKPVYLFEFDLDALQRTKVTCYSPVSKFPAIRRDLAFIVDKNVSVQTIKTIIYENAGNLLVNLIVFDLYQGQGIEPDKKSIALGLTLQHSSRTLNDSEVEDLMKHVVSSMKKSLDAKLRD